MQHSPPQVSSRRSTALALSPHAVPPQPHMQQHRAEAGQGCWGGASPAKGTARLGSAQQRPPWGPGLTAAAAALPLAPGRSGRQSSGAPLCTACSPPQGYAAACTSSATAANRDADLVRPCARQCFLLLSLQLSVGRCCRLCQVTNCSSDVQLLNCAAACAGQSSAESCSASEVWARWQRQTTACSAEQTMPVQH